LAGILERLPRTESPDLIVGMETMDDAGVFRITRDIALVQTVDFFYPIVNDPRAFGRIVAANSLSDAWAMGARVLTAMNILAYPAGKISADITEQLLKGGSEKLQEAGAVLVGGHTMEQEELVYGMSVTGTIHPDAVLTNRRAREGDRIILTKPLGTAVLSNALNDDALDEPAYEVFVKSMERLNVYAASALQRFDVSAVTDVTGFGLLGHALPMSRNSGVTIVIHAQSVPLLPLVLHLMAEFPSRGVCKNTDFAEPYMEKADDLDPRLVTLCLEAETSGGLLIAVHPGQAADLVNTLHEAGDAAAAEIGNITSARTRENGSPVYLRIEN